MTTHELLEPILREQGSAGFKWLEPAAIVLAHGRHPLAVMAHPDRGARPVEPTTRYLCASDRGLPLELLIGLVSE